jgi:S1-C subfamily serine protease
VNGSFEGTTPIFAVCQLLVIGFFPLVLTGCFGAAEPKPKTISQLAEEARKSIVLINYADVKGFGTGFFVQGSDGVCTVLTVAHVVKPSQKIQLTPALDKKLYKASIVKPLDKLDLAALTFEVPNNGKCPYPALELGDSDKVQIGDRVLLSGYPTREGESTVLLQSPKGDVTAIENPPLPEGYAISYDATSVSGMSGAPVLDVTGKVIAIHGQTDVEILTLAQKQQGSLSVAQAAKVAEISDRVEQVTRINHFKWGIPVKRYLLARSNLLLRPNDSISENEYKKGTKFYNERQYQKAIEAFNQAIKLKNDFAAAYKFRGLARSDSGDKKGAIADYEKAIQLNKDYAAAYNNRGGARLALGDTKGAITDFDKAIEINKNWDTGGLWTGYRNRGVTRSDLGDKQGAISDFDREHPTLAKALNQEELREPLR